MTQSWWKNAVGYQVYPRSFKDSNGDGIGDIQGIIEKLPYIKSLGIDFIWINPIYKSPNVDNGYDISDYQDIQPEFGTMQDFDELLKKAHALDIKVILDLVVNHTSDQHPWFLESKKSKSNPYREYYMWADATPNKMPNNWTSFSGQSTWKYDPETKQAYFHVFAPEQPDLNWRNPKVRQEIYQMIRWWLDLGIDGFRLDAISHIQKEKWNIKPDTNNIWSPFMNVTGIENYMSELRDVFNQYNIMTVGEASGVTSKQAPDWTDPHKSGYINMIFEWEHNEKTGTSGHERIDIQKMKNVLARWQEDQAISGWNALYFENHDNPRINTVLGNETAKSAKAIAMAYFFLKGTPFIYQGQELGMTNFKFTSIDQVDDNDVKLQYQKLIDSGINEKEALLIATHWIRDQSRTPMQWNSEQNAGFTSGKAWMPINGNTKEINVIMEELDADSVLNFYKKIIILRKNDDTFVNGSFEFLLSNNANIFAYLRTYKKKQFLVIVNLSDSQQKINLPQEIVSKDWKLWLTNNKSLKTATINSLGILTPYDGLIFLCKN